MDKLRSKPMILARYIATTGTLISLLYFGYIKGIDGAENMALCIAWFVSISTLIADLALTHSKDVFDQMEKSILNRVVPKPFDQALDFAIGLTFIWFGAWLTGVFYLLHLVFIGSIENKVKAGWSGNDVKIG